MLFLKAVSIACDEVELILFKFLFLNFICIVSYMYKYII